MTAFVVEVAAALLVTIEELVLAVTARVWTLGATQVEADVTGDAVAPPPPADVRRVWT